jgi:phosphopantothenoylcysteine decarboxylase/phosphopantothenate--cysteine ligase
MYEACHQYFDEMDVVIAAAAVADYKPKIVATQKIKKGRRYSVIELEKKRYFSIIRKIKKNQF